MDEIETKTLWILKTVFYASKLKKEQISKIKAHLKKLLGIHSYISISKSKQWK